MKRFFEVARLTFALSVPDDSPLWCRMGQYKPFLTEDPGDVIFTLETVESADFDSLEPEFTSDPEPGQPKISICSSPDGYRVIITDARTHTRKSLLSLSTDYTRASLYIGDSDALTVFNNAVMLTYAFRTASLGALEMHASVVACQGRGFLFTAPSGTGKSTHTSLWVKNIPGSELINDDNPIVRVMPDGQCLVFGSPWSGKTPCYRQVCRPIGAICRIVRDSVNRADKVGIIDAYASLYSACSGYRADGPMSDGLFDTMNALLCTIPFFDMHCRPDDEAAIVCSKAVL